MEAYQRVPIRMSLNVRKRSCESIYLDEQEQILQQAREALARHERFSERMQAMDTIQEESAMNPLEALREENEALEMQLEAQQARNRELEWMNKREMQHNPKFLTAKLPASCTPPRRRRLPTEKYVDSLQDYALKSSKAYTFLLREDKDNKDNFSDYGSGESLNDVSTLSSNSSSCSSIASSIASTSQSSLGSLESINKFSTSSSSPTIARRSKSLSRLSISTSCSALPISESIQESPLESLTEESESTDELPTPTTQRPASRHVSDPVISKSLPSSPVIHRKPRESVVFQDGRFHSSNMYKNTLPRSRLSIMQMIEDFQQKCTEEQKQHVDSDYEILDNPNTQQQLKNESEYEIQELYNSGSGEEGFYWFSKSIPATKYGSNSQQLTSSSNC